MTGKWLYSAPRIIYTGTIQNNNLTIVNCNLKLTCILVGIKGMYVMEKDLSFQCNNYLKSY